MKKVILPLLALGLLASACSAPGVASVGTDTPAKPTKSAVVTTTTVESPSTSEAPSPDEIAAAELAVDIERIESLFGDYSAEWFVSLEAATTYIAENVYPALDCTPDSALNTYGGVVGQRESIVVLADTVEQADGWVMPIGPSAGEAIEGRIYSFITETTVSVPGLEDVVMQDEAHATVVGDNAFFFFQCWDAALDG
jgi:hypothetical protein